MRPYVKRLLGGGLGLGLLALAGGGLLHTKAGRPLLARVGGCPVGKVSPAAVQERGQEVIASQRGTTKAPARPALGFELDRATIDDVRSWATEEHVGCVERREETLVLCMDVPASALGRASDGDIYTEISFAFRVKEKTLLDVTTLRSHLSPAQASRMTIALTAALERSLGAPTIKQGDATTAYLSEGAYATFAMNYRFEDYFADVTTMSLPAGVVVREQYLSARPPGGS